jgi:hypothetical protein
MYLFLFNFPVMGLMGPAKTRFAAVTAKKSSGLRIVRLTDFKEQTGLCATAVTRSRLRYHGIQFGSVYLFATAVHSRLSGDPTARSTLSATFFRNRVDFGRDHSTCR